MQSPSAGFIHGNTQVFKDTPHLIQKSTTDRDKLCNRNANFSLLTGMGTRGTVQTGTSRPQKTMLHQIITARPSHWARKYLSDTSLCVTLCSSFTPKKNTQPYIVLADTYKWDISVGGHRSNHSLRAKIRLQPCL